MTNHKTFLITTLIIFIIIGCGKQKSIKDVSPIPKIDTTKNNNQAENIFIALDSKVLLSRLFDNPEIDLDGTAIWKPNYYERMTFPVSHDNKCHTAIDTIMFFIDREKRKCACVILSTYNYRKGNFDDSTKITIRDCHFCGVPIGIALLSEEKDKSWELYKFEKSFTTLGYFGTYKTGRQDSGKISLKEIGDEWTCLSLIQGVGGNMGEFNGYENLYSIEEFQLGGFPNHILSNLFRYNYHYEYTSIDEKTKTEEDAEMKIVKKKDHYYDIDLITIKDGRKKTEHYKYSDTYDRYVER